MESLHVRGSPLDDSTKGFMESRFGYDFSKVRIHVDEHAEQSTRNVNALAYTIGSDIFFGAGQYDPQTENGRKLLAHELAHVVQQRASSDYNVVPSYNYNPNAPKISSPKGETYIYRQPAEPQILKDFEAKFPRSAAVIRKSASHMRIVIEGDKAGAKFGGYSEEGPASTYMGGCPYESVDTIYVPKAHMHLYEDTLAAGDLGYVIHNLLGTYRLEIINKYKSP